jgi:hypothetical protein
MAKRIIFLLFAVLLMTSFASALLDVNSNTNGLKLSYPNFDTIKNNQSFNITVYTYNVSDGRTLAGSNCSLQLFNHTGTMVYNSPNFTTFLTGYNHFVARGNFTINNDYVFNVYCENGALGGFGSGILSINAVGDELTIAKAIIYVTFFALLFFMFFINLVLIGKFPIGNNKDEAGIVTVTNMKYVTMALVYIEWLFVFAMVFIAYNIGQAYLLETLFANYLFMLWRVMGGLTAIFTLIWFFWIISNVINDKQIKNMMGRGLPGSEKPGKGARY